MSIGKRFKINILKSRQASYMSRVLLIAFESNSVLYSKKNSVEKKHIDRGKS